MTKIARTENDVKELIKTWFEGHGGFSVAIPANGMGTAGLPDRIGVLPITITAEMVGKTIGLAVAIEAKKPGRRGEKNAGATKPQVDMLLRFLNAHSLVGLVDCEPDLLRLDAILRVLMWHRVGDETWTQITGRLLAARTAGKDK